MKSTSNILRFNGVDPFDNWSTSHNELRGYYPRNSIISSLTETFSDGIGVYPNLCIVRNNIKVIKRSCFRNNQRFLSITLSEGIEVIEDYAFYNMKLKDIGIPKSVKKIAKHAFSKDITLFVYKDSYGERYARRNGFSYEYYDEDSL